MYFSRILTRFTEELHFNPSCPDPKQWEKFTEIFVFIFLFGSSKGFMKAIIKPFETPKRNEKTKVYLILIN